MSGGRTIPVIADEYVDMEFGTGALKITPGGALVSGQILHTMRGAGHSHIMLRRCLRYST